jgi:Uma2 family endonuclease
MATGTLISEEEYLNTSYEPDCEYEDGVLIERTVGTKKHGWLQTALSAYFFPRRKAWKICPYSDTRVKVRPGKYMLPDLCLLPAPDPDPGAEIITTVPLLWIEILSPDDRYSRVMKKVKDVLAMGCPYVWVIDPKTLESHLHTAQGSVAVTDETLRLPGTKIVVPLRDVLDS